MAYENGGCGPFEPAKVNTAYRGLYIDPAAIDTTFIVESHGQEQSLTVAAGVIFSGSLIIKSVTAGDISAVKGFLP